jgi:dCTP deaminase
MLLTRDAIKAEIKKGRIVIEPALPDSSIQVASVDLSLSNVFRVFQKAEGIIDVVEATDYREITIEIIKDVILLSPGETILGVTNEKITLPDDICGWLEGRSRFARLGLLIHISAGLIQPGVSNHQVLEITNLGPSVLALHAGERICQLAFQRLEGHATYNGKFQGQVRA